VDPIGIEDLRRLGIDTRNQLFWDGQAVEVRRTLVLTFWQKVLAVLASLATIATGANNLSLFLCGRDIHWLGCPAATPPLVIAAPAPPPAPPRPMPPPPPPPLPLPPVAMPAPPPRAAAPPEPTVQRP
jgi:hypothetical protein